VVIQQRDLTARSLADLLLGFTRDKLLEMAERARSLAKPARPIRVANVCAAAAG
jgi:UDP-N-acetylglucosamine--N-acetylmuramyl-(pentapeptide) pyrophosphoryl-undecaprenol N-acetylglucosamine transferase